MKMICAPSQVMREGSDLNQHGHAARQEQASSSSPVTFQEGVRSEAWAIAHTLINRARLEAIRTKGSKVIRLIIYFLLLAINDLCRRPATWSRVKLEMELFAQRLRPSRSVLECGSPLPLSLISPLRRLICCRSMIPLSKGPRDWRSPRPGGLRIGSVHTKRLGALPPVPGPHRFKPLARVWTHPATGLV